MSVIITTISNTDTFGTWKTKTNDLIAVAAKAVTMGDANAGNIALNGDITLETGHTITVDNIIKSSSASIISLKSDTKVEGNLTIDNGEQVAKLQIARNASNKWTIETNTTHSELKIKNVGGNFIQFTSTAITTSGMTMNEDVLPATLTKRITHTGTGSSGSSFADCDIAAGNITGLSTLGTSGSPIVSSVLTSADINGGTIDNTPIGNSSRSTGKFSTVNATGTITANAFSGSLAGNVNGNLTGNVTSSGTSTFGTLTASTINMINIASTGLGTFSTVDINGGAIDGTPIGSSSRSTGKFSSVNATLSVQGLTLSATGQVSGGSLDINGNADISGNLVVGGTLTANVTGSSGTAGGLTDSGLTAVLKAVYPIGSLYTTTTGVDPSTARAANSTGGLGFGTWQRYAQGRTLVSHDNGITINSASCTVELGGEGIITLGVSERHGIRRGDLVNISGFAVGSDLNRRYRVLDTNSSSIELKNIRNIPATNDLTAQAGQTRSVVSDHYDTLGMTDGQSNVYLTANQSGLPFHTHTLLGGGFNGSSGAEPGSNRNTSLGETGSAGGTDAAWSHSNMMPYSVVSIWKRIA